MFAYGYRQLRPYFATLLLLIYFAQGMAHTRHASITFDEGPHLAIGYATLRTGDFRLQPVHIHPPLANALAAAPLLLQNDLPDPRAIPGWEIASLSAVSDAVVWQYPHPARMATASRLPILWLGVLLGALIIRWAKECGGLNAGLLAACLYAFDPNFIAHGSLVTTDMGAVFFTIATLYALDHCLTLRRLRTVAAARQAPTDKIDSSKKTTPEPSQGLQERLRTTAAARQAPADKGASAQKTTRKPSQGLPFIKLALAGVLLGAAQLTKVSALMLVPVVGLILLIQALPVDPKGLRTAIRKPNMTYSGTQSQRINIMKPLESCPQNTIASQDWMQRTWSTKTFLAEILPPLVISGGIVFGVAFLIIWAGYCFELIPVPGIPFKVPAGTHVLIYQSLREHYDLGHPAFLMGQVSSQGWRGYFPVAFVLKTPLPVLLLTAWALFRALRNISISPRSPRLPSTDYRLLSPAPEGEGGTFRTAARLAPLVVFPLLYIISSPFSTVNIGYRHLLPLLPFLYISIGVALAAPMDAIRKSRPQPAKFALTLLLLWLALGTALIAPHYLTFFNALAGGAAGGYRYLVDSNLDWGQNLWDLKHWMAKHGEGHVAYAHYSPARPRVYGIEADFLPPDPRAVAFTPWDPAPGLYAIGATVLQGPYAPDINTYAWFRTHKALARLGNALWLYQVSPRPAASWAVLCALEPSPETVRAKLNATTGQGTRVLQPDCAQAWIFPPGPGVYVVPAKDTKASLTTIPSPAAPATVAVPPGAQLELQARRADGSAFYVVYRLDSAHLPPAQTMGDVRVNGPLSFLGYTLTTTQIIPGEVIGCHTYWQVRDLSQEGQGEAWAGRPLSLMAHLIGPDGTAVDVRDGLGVPIEQWQPGDIIVQRHTLNVPAGAPSGTYVIHVGAYWLDTMARWTVQDAMGTDDKIVIRVNAP